jgi:hypothetical protein
MKIEKIITHVNVDIDAVIGTCVELINHDLVPNEDTVRFVPADTFSVEENELAVDIRARKHGNAPSYVGWQCADLLPWNVVEEVNQQDFYGGTDSLVSLASIVNALRADGLSDLEIVQAFKNEAVKIFETLEVVQIQGYEFVITNNNNNHFVGKVAQKAGLTGSIFQSDTGWGITRYPGQNKPDFSGLHLPGWFAHPAGFLFCWGSRKSPKKGPPPQFVDLDEFINWLDSQELGL